MLALASVKTSVLNSAMHQATSVEWLLLREWRMTTSPGVPPIGSDAAYSNIYRKIFKGHSTKWLPRPVASGGSDASTSVF